MNEPLDYEKPDWTPEEKRQEPPFSSHATASRSAVIKALRERHERELRALRRKMWVTIIVCGVVGAVLLWGLL